MRDERELIDRDGDELLKAYFLELEKYRGVKCGKCGVVQAQPLKGWKEYWCEHIDAKVSRKVKPMEKALWQRITTDIQCGGLEVGARK